jgi:hypothetical protein
LLPHLLSLLLVNIVTGPEFGLPPILDEEALQMALQGETRGIFFGSYGG